MLFCSGFICKQLGSPYFTDSLGGHIPIPVAPSLLVPQAARFPRAQQNWGLLRPPFTGLIPHLSSAQMLYQINQRLGNLPPCHLLKWHYFRKIREDRGRDLGQAYAEGGGREERCRGHIRGLGKEHGHGGIWGGQWGGRGDGGGKENVEK